MIRGGGGQMDDEKREWGFAFTGSRRGSKWRMTTTGTGVVESRELLSG